MQNFTQHRGLVPLR